MFVCLDHLCVLQNVRVCVCVRTCVRACVRTYVRTYVRTFVRMCVRATYVFSLLPNQNTYVCTYIRKYVRREFGLGMLMERTRMDQPIEFVEGRHFDRIPHQVSQQLSLCILLRQYHHWPMKTNHIWSNLFTAQSKENKQFNGDSN